MKTTANSLNPQLFLAFWGAGKALLLLGGIVAFLLLAAPVQADTRLPPRPPLPQPTVTPPAPPAPALLVTPGEPAPGAHIWLIAVDAPGGAWARVEWQATDDTWHEVAGWQADLLPGRSQRWWVAPQHFGAGPFRWVVTQEKDGPVWSVSQPFLLPGEADSLLVVESSWRP